MVWNDPTCRWSNPNRKPTATLTASSSNLSPHEAIGSAKSQSPLCCEEAASNDARWCADVRLASTLALSSSTPEWSQNGCLLGRGSGTSPNFTDQSDKYRPDTVFAVCLSVSHVPVLCLNGSTYRRLVQFLCNIDIFVDWKRLTKRTPSGWPKWHFSDTLEGQENYEFFDFVIQC